MSEAYLGEIAEQPAILDRLAARFAPEYGAALGGLAGDLAKGRFDRVIVTGAWVALGPERVPESWVTRIVTGHWNGAAGRAAWAGAAAAGTMSAAATAAATRGVRMVLLRWSGHDEGAEPARGSTPLG